MAYICSNSWLNTPQFISSTVIPDLLPIFWWERVSTGGDGVLGYVVVVYGKLVLDVEELDKGVRVALTPVVDGAMPEPGHGLLLEPCLCSVPSLRWTLKVKPAYRADASILR